MENSILIIDDEVEILKLLETVLKKEGLNNIYTAKTRKEGLEVFKNINPDLIILDIMLPEGAIIINNIFSTLFLIAIYLQAIEFIKKFRKEKEVKYLIIGLLMIIIPVILGIFTVTLLFKAANKVITLFMILVPVPFLVEGGPIWIILGIIFYLCRGKKFSLSIYYVLMCMFIFVAMANGDYSLKNSILQNYQWMMVASLPLMLLYNGEKGKSLKYLFYLYYPIHIYILYILGIYLINGLSIASTI